MMSYIRLAVLLITGVYSYLEHLISGIIEWEGAQCSACMPLHLHMCGVRKGDRQMTAIYKHDMEHIWAKTVNDMDL